MSQTYTECNYINGNPDFLNPKTGDQRPNPENSGQTRTVGNPSLNGCQCFGWSHF